MANGTTSTAEDRAVDALIELIRSSATPELIEAQTVLARRLALQGDVIGSRVPPPRNITEIGGYLNMLEKLREQEMRAQVLAGILGVAGPNPPLGWLAAAPPLAMEALPNDRPEGEAQATFPLTVAVRSDFAPFVKSALDELHQRGAALPLSAPATALPPPSATFTPPADFLPFIGRVLQVVPSAALRDPTADPVALVRPQGSTDPFVVAARVLQAGSVAVTPDDYDALECDTTACTPVAIDDGEFVPVAPILASAGFYPVATPVPEPESTSSTEWTRFVNVSGLVAGVTKLGDELSLLHSSAQIGASALNALRHWVWDGTTFVAT